MDKEKNGQDARQSIGRHHSQDRVLDKTNTHTTDGRVPVDDLIILSLNGSASPFEEERLRRWREESPGNERHFHEMARVWELTAPEPAVIKSGPPAVEAILAQAPTPLHRPETSASRAPSSRRISWAPLALLAASVAAIALGIGTFGLGTPAPAAFYEANQGESLTLTLRDGSFVRLAEGGTLSEWEVEGRREVSLEGKGFFAVARDESQPFVVRTGVGEIEVLGTRFQVKSDDGWVETVVVEGLVRATNGQGSAEVPAGHMVRMEDGHEPTARGVDDVYALLDWPQGILVFQATPLSQVVDEVARYYDRTIHLNAPELALRRVTAWFQGDDFESVVESLCVVTEAACQTAEGIVTMTPRGSGEG